jgi:hypothetical protein
MIKTLNTAELNTTLEDLESWEFLYQDKVFESTDFVDKEDYLTENEQEELEELRQLKSDIGVDWGYSVDLIPEKEFNKYIQEEIEEEFDIPEILRGNIDWQGVADDVQSDYSSVEYQGVTYYYK